MKHSSSIFRRPVILGLFALLLLGLGAGASYSQWKPKLDQWLGSTKPTVLATGAAALPAHDEHDGHDHAAHSDDHPGHTEANALEISEQARRSMGLKVGPAFLSDYTRTISIPGMVIQRRGRSQLNVVAPLTGVVTRIYPSEGEGVALGQPLFEMRLTHEELVQSQADLLRTAEELDVVQREITRLESVGKDGAIAGKNILDRKYEQQKQQAILRAQKQAIILHGLSEEQVESILKDRVLLKSLSVVVPSEMEVSSGEGATSALQVQELKVERGQHVNAGELLAVLVDHSALLIEGEAFEQDIPAITQAVDANRTVTAVLESKGSQSTTIKNLKIEYLANRVEPVSRAIHFYVALPNVRLRDPGNAPAESHRFIDWQYKPGQRMLLRVPVEQWTNRFVLPTEAVAQDGIENFVFLANGDHFDRQAVAVEYRDQFSVVIAQDGSVKPGQKIARSGAQQLLLAIKNKSVGAVDPHAGHTH